MSSPLSDTDDELPTKMNALPEGVQLPDDVATTAHHVTRKLTSAPPPPLRRTPPPLPPRASQPPLLPPPGSLRPPTLRPSVAPSVTKTLRPGLPPPTMRTSLPPPPSLRPNGPSAPPTHARSNPPPPLRMVAPLPLPRVPTHLAPRITPVPSVLVGAAIEEMEYPTGESTRAHPIDDDLLSRTRQDETATAPTRRRSSTSPPPSASDDSTGSDELITRSFDMPDTMVRSDFGEHAFGAPRRPQTERLAASASMDADRRRRFEEPSGQRERSSSLLSYTSPVPSFDESLLSNGGRVEDLRGVGFPRSFASSPPGARDARDATESTVTELPHRVEPRAEMSSPWPSQHHAPRSWEMPSRGGFDRSVGPAPVRVNGSLASSRRAAMDNWSPSMDDRHAQPMPSAYPGMAGKLAPTVRPPVSTMLRPQSAAPTKSAILFFAGCGAFAMAFAFFVTSFSARRDAARDFVSTESVGTVAPTSTPVNAAPPAQVVSPAPPPTVMAAVPPVSMPVNGAPQVAQAAPPMVAQVPQGAWASPPPGTTAWVLAPVTTAPAPAAVAPPAIPVTSLREVPASAPPRASRPAPRRPARPSRPAPKVEASSDDTGSAEPSNALNDALAAPSKPKSGSRRSAPANDSSDAPSPPSGANAADLLGAALKP